MITISSEFPVVKVCFVVFGVYVSVWVTYEPYRRCGDLTVMSVLVSVELDVTDVWSS